MALLLQTQLEFLQVWQLDPTMSQQGIVQVVHLLLQWVQLIHSLPEHQAPLLFLPVTCTIGTELSTEQAETTHILQQTLMVVTVMQSFS